MELDKQSMTDASNDDQLQAEFQTGLEIKRIYAPSPAGYNIDTNVWYEGEQNRHLDDWGEEANDITSHPVVTGRFMVDENAHDEFAIKMRDPETGEVGYNLFDTDDNSGVSDV